MADESAAWTWKGVIARLREAPTGSTVQIAVSAIEEPTSVGLHPMPTGADGRPVFGVVLDEQVGILVQVCDETYEARLCQLPQLAATPPPASALSLPQATTLSLPRSVAVAHQNTDATSLPSVPVVLDARTDLVIQRPREPRSLVSIPAQLPSETMLTTTLLGTLLGFAFGGARGALAGALAGGGESRAVVMATSPHALPCRERSHFAPDHSLMIALGAIHSPSRQIHGHVTSTRQPSRTARSLHSEHHRRDSKAIHRHPRRARRR